MENAGQQLRKGLIAVIPINHFIDFEILIRGYILACRIQEKIEKGYICHRYIIHFERNSSYFKPETKSFTEKMI